MTRPSWRPSAHPRGLVTGQGAGISQMPAGQRPLGGVVAAVGLTWKPCRSGPGSVCRASSPFGTACAAYAMLAGACLLSARKSAFDGPRRSWLVNGRGLAARSGTKKPVSCSQRDGRYPKVSLGLFNWGRKEVRSAVVSRPRRSGKERGTRLVNATDNQRNPHFGFPAWPLPAWLVTSAGGKNR